jgi:predicted nucleotidyltransferase
MHADIARNRPELAALARRYGVTRLEVFGSAARGDDFGTSHSDADLLVTFSPTSRDDLAALADFKDALEALLGRPVDLVEREAVERSRNFIRRRRILPSPAVDLSQGALCALTPPERHQLPE